MIRIPRATLPALLLCSGLAGAGSSEAAESGWYAGALFGTTGHGSQTLSLEDGATESGRARFGADFLAGGSVGYQFGNRWRLEGEFVYQSVSRDNAPFAAPDLQGGGNFASTGVAVNALYEFDLFGSPKARTYLGAGVVVLTEVDIDFETPAGERSFSGDGTAFQLLAGVRYDLEERWFLDLGWRQLYASGLNLDGEGAASGRIRADYEPWAVTFGAGFRF